MAREELLKQVEKYFDKCCTDTEHYIRNGCPHFKTPRQYVEDATYEMLGVSQFVQFLGVEFKDVEPLYTGATSRLELFLLDI